MTDDNAASPSPPPWPIQADVMARLDQIAERARGVDQGLYTFEEAVEDVRFLAHILAMFCDLLRWERGQPVAQLTADEVQKVRRLWDSRRVPTSTIGQRVEPDDEKGISAKLAALQRLLETAPAPSSEG